MIILIQHRKIAEILQEYAEIFHCMIEMLQKHCKILLQYCCNIAAMVKRPP